MKEEKRKAKRYLENLSKKYDVEQMSTKVIETMI